MDRVSAGFYNNVHVLTQFIEPHNEFKKFFKQNMFDKPNSPGFINVSYYLLCVHYKEKVKSKISWPIACKHTENQFRKDVRENLLTIANENADVNFPPILASHLLLAKGSKFLLIMWKFSLVVLRTYLQEHNCILPSMPKAGPCTDLTKLFLTKAASDNQDIISVLRKDRESVEVQKEILQKKKTQEITDLKARILILKKKLNHVTSTAPANEVAKTRLLNIGDNEIINIWYCQLNTTSVDNVQNHYDFFKDIDDRLNYLVKIMLNLAGNSLQLNSSNFDKINVEPIYKLVPLEKQVLLYDLYNKNNLYLKNLFSIFYLLIIKYAKNVKRDDFSKCNLQLQRSLEDLRIATNHLQILKEEMDNFTFVNNLNYNKLKKLNSSDSIKTASYINNDYINVLFLPSPTIQINNCKGEREIQHQDYLQLTPIEGAHKQLFSRHAINNEKVYSVKKKLMPVMQINFDDSIEMSAIKFSTLQPRFNKPLTLKKYNLKNADKYSRIFSPFKPSVSTVNRGIDMIIPNTENSILSSTSKHCLRLMDSYNSNQDFSQEPLLMHPNLNSTTIQSKLEEKEKVSQNRNKRRSIGDLVERYKKLLQKRDVDLEE